MARLSIPILAASLWLAPLAATCAPGQESGGRPAGRQQPPAELKVEARRVKLTKPIVRSIEGSQRTIREVIEFEVTSPKPIPARALDPVLTVGDRRVTEYRYVRKNVLVFTEYRPEKLQEGERVYFQWGETPVAQERHPTALIFQAARLETVTRPPG